jgi:hypothetical protein
LKIKEAQAVFKKRWDFTLENGTIQYKINLKSPERA